MDFSFRTSKAFSLAGKIALYVFAGLLIGGIILFSATAISWYHISQKQRTIVTPYDFPGSTWVSDEPEMMLKVSETSSVPIDSDCYLIVDGEKIDAIFYPGFPQNASIEKRGDGGDDMVVVHDARMLVCSGKYSEDKVELKILGDYVFGGKYKIIVLNRIDID